MIQNHRLSVVVLSTPKGKYFYQVMAANKIYQQPKISLPYIRGYATLKKEKVA